MEPAPIPAGDPARVAAIEKLQILEKTPDRMWDHLAQLASTICDTPIALVTVVGHDEQRFAANVGLSVSGTGRAESFCGHAILEKELFTVPDALNDVRFFDNPLVIDDPSIRFYAGMPVHLPDGQPMGTVCVIDRRPRMLNTDQKRALELLARHAEEMLQTRAAAIELQHLTEAAEREHLQSAVNEISHDVGTPLTPIMNRIHLLKKMVPEGDARRYVDEIEANIRRLVNSLRNVSARILGAPEPPK